MEFGSPVNGWTASSAPMRRNPATGSAEFGMISDNQRLLNPSPWRQDENLFDCSIRGSDSDRLQGRNGPSAPQGRMGFGTDGRTGTEGQPGGMRPEFMARRVQARSSNLPGKRHA